MNLSSVYVRNNPFTNAAISTCEFLFQNTFFSLIYTLNQLVIHFFFIIYVTFLYIRVDSLVFIMYFQLWLPQTYRDPVTYRQLSVFSMQDTSPVISEYLDSKLHFSTLHCIRSDRGLGDIFCRQRTKTGMHHTRISTRQITLLPTDIIPVSHSLRQVRHSAPSTVMITNAWSYSSILSVHGVVFN